MKTRRWIASSLSIAALLLPAQGLSQEPGGTLAIKAGRVHTWDSDLGIENGVVVIDNGIIVAVGGPDTPIPAGVEIIDAGDAGLFPGLFDAVSRLGITEIGAVDVTNDSREMGDNNAHLQAATAVHPASEILPVTRAEGITHAVAAPTGSGIAGQGSLIHMAGWTIEEMSIKRGAYMAVQWPRLRGRRFGFGFGGAASAGEFSERKERYDEQIQMYENLLEDARRYQQAAEANTVVSREMKLEALAKVASGEMPMVISANDTRSITDAVEFGERNNVRVIIAGGSEAWKVREMLAAKNIPVILSATQALPAAENDPYDSIYAQPGMLHEAGVKFAISTFNASASRTLPFEAATAVPYGLPYREALKAITLYPAQILGVDDRLGSIEVGKLANLIVVEGDPLDIRSSVTHLIINGQVVSTDNKHRQLYERYRARPQRGPTQ